MIVPIAFSIQHEEEPEEFVVTNASGVLPVHTFQKMRVKLILFDTDAGIARGFSAQVLYDQSAETGHELMTLFSAGTLDVIKGLSSTAYLRELRDEIDQLLGDADE